MARVQVWVDAYGSIWVYVYCNLNLHQQSGRVMIIIIERPGGDVKGRGKQRDIGWRGRNCARKEVWKSRRRDNSSHGAAGSQMAGKDGRRVNRLIEEGQVMGL